MATATCQQRRCLLGVSQLTHSFSDAQLVNALSLLASAFINRCDISTYDWQMLVSCVWFASLTQLATIPLLNRQFRKVRLLAYIRVLLMTVVLILLILALIPTAHADWMRYPDDLAVCYLDFNTNSLPAHGYYSSWRYSKTRLANGLSLAWSIGLLGFTYVRRTVSLLCGPFGVTAWPTRLRLWLRRQGLALTESFECRISDSRSKKHTIGLALLCIPMSILSTLRALLRLSESFFGHVSKPQPLFFREPPFSPPPANQLPHEVSGHTPRGHHILGDSRIGETVRIHGHREGRVHMGRWVKLSLSFCCYHPRSE